MGGGGGRSRDTHLFCTNSPPASSCIWAASHAKRQPVPVQLPLGVWGAPLQQDMCYWLEEQEIRLQNTRTPSLPLSFPSFLFNFHVTSSSVSRSLFPFLLPPYFHVFSVCGTSASCSASGYVSITGTVWVIAHRDNLTGPSSACEDKQRGKIFFLELLGRPEFLFLFPFCIKTSRRAWK